MRTMQGTQKTTVKRYRQTRKNRRKCGQVDRQRMEENVEGWVARRPNEYRTGNAEGEPDKVRTLRRLRAHRVVQWRSELLFLLDAFHSCRKRRSRQPFDVLESDEPSQFLLGSIPNALHRPPNSRRRRSRSRSTREAAKDTIPHTLGGEVVQAVEPRLDERVGQDFAVRLDGGREAREERVPRVERQGHQVSSEGIIVGRRRLGG